MESRYLLRFDDICPTMNWGIWNRLEALLDAHGVKPLVAVIPDNQDPKLRICPAAPDFWDRVRGWQARGWSIGLHGYQHLYVNKEPGILKLSHKSEFAGLPEEVQLDKLRKGMEIFTQEGVRADGWVAPSHSFDWATVSALNTLGIRVISDGLALSPYQDARGNVWVPQQFATARAYPWGIWTFCYHMNDFMEEAQWAHFERRIVQLKSRMITLQDAAALGDRTQDLRDLSVAWARHALTGGRRLMQSLARR